MEVIIVENQEEVCRLASQRLLHLISEKPQCILGLATGRTPLGVYKKLVEHHASGQLNCSQMTTFNLDEYVGVDASQASSYASYMKNNFFEPLGIKKEQTHLPNGVAKDIALECARYEALIKEKGPIDLQLLGIGRDGHIGFNEPGSSLGSRTRLKTLTEQTRADNAPNFSEAETIPHHVITMGIQTIMDSRELVLIACGEAKAEAIAQAVEGPVTSFIPASVLQFHSNVKIIVDEAAAKNLKNKDYYKEVFAKKPPWQAAEFL